MRILRLILVVFVVILFIATLFFLIFGLSKDKKIATNTATSVSTGVAAAANSDATVSFVNDGQINGNEAHKQITITISKTARTMTVYQGYEGKVAGTFSFVNNQSAFEDFLAAINDAGFTKERVNPTTASVTGQCPLGSRYIYSSTAIQNVPNNLWTTTCGSKTGTFGGNSGLINQLFQLQIPNYSTLVSQVKF